MWFFLACSVESTLVPLNPLGSADAPGIADGSGGLDDPADAVDVESEATDSDDPLDRCASFGEPRVVGQMPPGLDEVSGMVASRSQPGVLWVVEDSGNEAVVYALDIDGALLARVHLDVPNQDWEELSLASCGEHDCLQVADVGDNALARSSVQLYRFVEPQLPTGDLRLSPSVEVIEYGDGAHNVEAVVVDGRGRTTLFSKREDGTSEVIQNLGGVYAAVASFAVAGEGDSSWDSKLTGASWDPEHRDLYLRTYARLARFAVGDGSFATLAHTFREAVEVEPQPQVEVVAFDSALRGLWEVSEGEGAALLFTTCAD